jgi:hypothetical protein
MREKQKKACLLQHARVWNIHWRLFALSYLFWGILFAFALIGF